MMVDTFDLSAKQTRRHFDRARNITWIFVEILESKLMETRIVKAYNLDDAQHDIENIVQISNGNAELSYRAFFDDLFQSQARNSDEHDISFVTIENAAIPVLKNGSCAYAYYSSNQLELSSRIEERVHVDAFVVVPETSRILHENSNYNGLVSALNNQTAINKFKIMDGYSLLRIPRNVLNAIRQYDSHLSALSYWQIVAAVLKRLGVDRSDPEIEFWPSQYECDIALKFIRSPFISYVAAEKYLVVDEAPDNGRNRGIYRRYTNAVPCVDARILIMGDSHSYTMMAQMFSHVFRETHFFWVNRALSDSSHWATIDKLTNECDFVIEEMSERFFMANFCQLKSS